MSKKEDKDIEKFLGIIDDLLQESLRLFVADPFDEQDDMLTSFLNASINGTVRALALFDEEEISEEAKEKIEDLIFKKALFLLYAEGCLEFKVPEKGVH